MDCSIRPESRLCLLWQTQPLLSHISVIHTGERGVKLVLNIYRLVGSILDRFAQISMISPGSFYFCIVSQSHLGFSG